MSIIIGIGTGRCGTASLARLINAQEKSVCFHEINPKSMSWSNSLQEVQSMLREFRNVLEGGSGQQLSIDLTSPDRDTPMHRLHQLSEIATIGEIGFYYLSYVEQIIAKNPDVRFPCMRRDKTETIRSYVNKMQATKYKESVDSLSGQVRYRNHWVSHSGEKWVLDDKWDKCYPKFDANTLEDALSMYWDSYYAEAERLSAKYKQVQIFDLDTLNDPCGQKQILSFSGISAPKTIVVHENTSF